jgi:hypothetical protein
LFVNTAGRIDEEATGRGLEYPEGRGRTPVVVAYQTADGSAQAGADYTATTDTLAFGPGETQHTVSVPILDDAMQEDSETFSLHLSSTAANNAATSTAAILDDDAGPVHILAAGDVAVNESAGQAAFSVTLLPAPGPGEQVVVAYQTDGR